MVSALSLWSHVSSFPGRNANQLAGMGTMEPDSDLSTLCHPHNSLRVGYHGNRHLEGISEYSGAA